MTEITVELEGAEELMRRVQVWQQLKTKRIRDLVERTLDDIAETAAQNAPKMTGKLREALKAELYKTVAGLPVLGGEVRVEVFYARFVELGTQSSPPHPFLFPALEAHWPRFWAELQRILNRPETL